MARIIYGVHGIGHGHTMRAMTVARHFPEHQFLFLSDAEGGELLKTEFQVINFPNPETPVRSHKVALGPLVSRNLKVFLKKSSLIKKMIRIFSEFKPDIAISDYEYFVPLASKAVGLPCLSIDHTHVVSCCEHSIPLSQTLPFYSTWAAVKALYNHASDYMVVSFYHPPLKQNSKAWLVPPLLRDSVLSQEPGRGEHVVAYHGFHTSDDFFSMLSEIPRQVHVYGSNVEHTSGNLVFKKKSEYGFLKDLASCQYVICSSGHTLISEALYYGKPIVGIPIKGQYEQTLNCHYLEKLGLGVHLRSFKPDNTFFEDFEDRLPSLKKNIGRDLFCGNEEIYSLLNYYIKNGSLPDFHAGSGSEAEPGCGPPFMGQA